MHLQTNESTGYRPRAWLWLAGLFLAGFGAKLWLIHAFGTSLPFWDQWEEARVVYVPFFEGKLTWADLISPHNEHRILLTRLYGLALLLWNGQWDNQVQMVANAAIHTATLVALGALMLRLLDRRHAPWLLLPLAAALIPPFAWENTMAGFHSQHYFMVVFALPTLWLLGAHAPGSLRWWCGALAALGGLFTVGAGFLAAATVFGWVTLKILLDRTAWKKLWPTLAVGIIAVGLGLALNIKVPHHEVLKAHSAVEFLVSLGKYLAWPWIVLPPYAVFSMFPLALLAWRYWRDPAARTRAAELTLLVGLWTVLQCLAAAYARGAKGAHPQWRYMDTTSFLMIVNAWSLLLLWVQGAGRLPFRRYFPAATALWALACGTGLGLLSQQAWRCDIPVRQIQHRLAVLTTRAYLATGDPRYFDVHRREYLAVFQGNPDLPQDHARQLIERLQPPVVRSILPACVCDPIPLAPALANGFVTNNAPLATPGTPGETFWSSFNSRPAAGQGRFESQPLRKAKLPWLEFRVAGDLGAPGLSLAVVDLVSGKTTALEPRRPAGPQWASLRIKSPPGEFKIVATDDSPTGWLAFQPPREVGQLSAVADRVAAWGAGLFGFGLGLCGVAGIRCITRRQAVCNN